MDLDETDEQVDTELQSISNLQSSEGEGDGDGAAHRSHSNWLWSQPHCGAHPWSWWDTR